MPETGDGTQGLPEKPTLSRMPWSPGSGAPLCGTQGAAAYTGACGSARSKGRPRPLEAARPCAAHREQRRIPAPVVPPDQRKQRARRWCNQTAKRHAALNRRLLYSADQQWRQGDHVASRRSSRRSTLLRN